MQKRLDLRNVLGNIEKDGRVIGNRFDDKLGCINRFVNFQMNKTLSNDGLVFQKNIVLEEKSWLNYIHNLQNKYLNDFIHGDQKKWNQFHNLFSEFKNELSSYYYDENKYRNEVSKPDQYIPVEKRKMSEKVYYLLSAKESVGQEAGLFKTLLIDLSLDTIKNFNADNKKNLPFSLTVIDGFKVNDNNNEILEYLNKTFYKV